MRTAFAAVVAIGLTAGVGITDDKNSHHKAVPQNPALEKFKQLAGDWVGKAGSGKDSFDATVNYKVMGNGTSVVETIGPGTPFEMITVIHSDGDKLGLTHYCGIGNQPHMKATVKEGDKEVAFKFTHATNMKSEKETHMRDVTFTFVDKDTIKVAWQNYVDGKPGGTMVFDLKRKK